MPQKTEISDRRFLNAVRELEPAKTKDVVEEVGITRRAGLGRLRELEEEGKLRSEKQGKYLIWHKVEQENPLTEIFEEVTNE